MLNINLGKESFYKNIFRLRHQNDFDSIVSLFLGVFNFWSVLIVKTDGKIDEIQIEIWRFLDFRGSLNQSWIELEPKCYGYITYLLNKSIGNAYRENIFEIYLRYILHKKSANLTMLKYVRLLPLLIWMMKWMIKVWTDIWLKKYMSDFLPNYSLHNC